MYELAIGDQPVNRCPSLGGDTGGGPLSLLYSHLSLTLTYLSLSHCFGVRGRSNYGPTPQVPRDCVQCTHHMYIGFPWSPCPYAPCPGKRGDEGRSRVVRPAHSGSGIIAPGWHNCLRGCRSQRGLIVLVGGSRVHESPAHRSAQRDLVQRCRYCHHVASCSRPFVPFAVCSRAVISYRRERSA